MWWISGSGRRLLVRRCRRNERGFRANLLLLSLMCISIVVRFSFGNLVRGETVVVVQL
jgi:hypothetical protein